MIKEYTSNKELADAYKRIASQIYHTKDNLRNALKRADTIRDCNLNIPKYYDRNSTLSGLTITGIGNATLRILEEIIALGEDQVIEHEVGIRSKPDEQNRSYLDYLDY